MIDLHTHSKASDGSMSPGELIRHARNSGLSAIALTDHDTVEGINEALEEADHIGLELIPGVEIGVDFETEMHILGYFSRENYRCIDRTLQLMRKNREERNPKIIRKLAEMGFDISEAEVLAQAGGNVVGRPHIAAVLIEKGYVRDIKEAFDLYLSPGKPAYFKKDKLTPEKGINAIIRCGGIPVLAHPVLLGMEFEKLDSLLAEMAEYGLAGIEVYYAENAESDTSMLLRLAKKHGLIATGGSDFHGNLKSDIELGVGHGDLFVPYEVLEDIKRRLQKNPS